MLKIPRVIIILIAEYLNVTDYLNLRVTCKKCMFLSINHLRLKITDTCLTPGKYNYIHYIGNDPEKHLKDCIIRKLRLVSDTYFDFSNVYKLDLESNKRYWNTLPAKSVRVSNVRIVSNFNKIKTYEGYVGKMINHEKEIPVGEYAMGIIDLYKKHNKNLYIYVSPLRTNQEKQKPSNFDFDSYKKIK